jgi:hypothetical protein
MGMRRQQGDGSRLGMLRDPKSDFPIDQITVAGADDAVRRRLGEFLDLFLEHGARLVDLSDPVKAVGAGAVLNAPFVSIADVNGLVIKLVLDAVAAEGTAEALAALLALSAATDGEMEALAGVAAASMGSGLPEPPWSGPARQAVGAPTFELLSDLDVTDVRGLLVTVDVAGANASFFLRFHRGSLIAERIHYLPGTRRRALLADLAQVTDLTAPYRYVPRAEIGPEDQVGVVNAILQANEESLRLTPFPPYPPSLAEVASLRDVTVVPAILVLLRKFQGSAAGLVEWDFGRDYFSIWA